MRYLIVEADVRYWEDATINGVEDIEGALTPFKRGNLWAPVIDLFAGTVVDWPKGTTADIHFKVCDAGEYWLSSDGKTKEVKWGGYYVPDDYLCHGDPGYGDYIIMKIDAEGKIENYSPPDIDLEAFKAKED